MATFLVSHGAWSAGWAWKKMHPLMSARRHRLITPTLTGLGERSHLAHFHVRIRLQQRGQWRNRFRQTNAADGQRGSAADASFGIGQ